MKCWQKENSGFAHDKAPAKINELKSESFSHLAYSLDLVPSVSSPQENQDNEEVIHAENPYFEELHNSHYKKDITAYKPLAKNVCFHGDHVKKQSEKIHNKHVFLIRPDTFHLTFVFRMIA